MREITCTALAAVLTAGSLVQAQEPSPATIVAEMRRALGGDTALDAVRTIRGSGVATRVLGELRVAGEVEILLAPPDRYRRTDRLKVAGVTSEVTTGLNGGTFLQRASGPNGVRTDPVAALDPGVRAVVAEGAARGARHDLIRLLLALVGTTRELSLSFTLSGTAEGPDWTADVLQVEGPDGFAARLLVDTRTRLPRLIAWDGPDTPGAIRRLTASYSSSNTGTPDTSAADLLNQAQAFVEHRLYLSDYRRFGALTWPHRFRRTAGSEPIEDISFERFWINPPVEAHDFDPDR